MKRLVIVMLGIVMFSSLVDAGVGFGLTDLQQEVIMAPDADEACVTYYLFNPGTVDIEGFLKLDKDGGDGLNKLLGIEALYEELAVFEEKGKELALEYEAITERGESTFDIEQKIQKLADDSSPITEKIQSLQPQDSIIIPAGTRAKDANGNYQIPISICFPRPKIKYLYFFEVVDTEFCGLFEGEVVGTYNPVFTDGNAGQRTGSAIIGSRATRLKVRVQCGDVAGKGAVNLKIGVMAGAIFLVILMFILWKRLSKKAARKQMEPTPRPIDQDPM